MEMHQVRYFLALANTLNFTRAAEECNVTQPALTRSIKQLEEELGGELIRRERSHSHLTELGKSMLPLLRQCHDAASSAKSLARAAQGSDAAVLAVTISNSVNIDLLMSTIAELLRVHPRMQLRIHRGSPIAVIDTLKGGDVEIAVAGMFDGEWDRLDRWALFSEKIEMVVGRSHRFGSGDIDDVGLSELSSETVVHRVACEYAEELSRCLAAGGVAAGTVHMVETDHDMLALRAAGGGVGFVSTTAPQSVATRRVPLRDVSLSRTVVAYGVTGRQRSPGATTLLNMLRAADWSPFGVSEVS
jgi:DNA-binding transcriptional LysR family regulator